MDGPTYARLKTVTDMNAIWHLNVHKNKQNFEISFAENRFENIGSNKNSKCLGQY